jgi:tripartite-type tricarboxylate transporter receptor subunit TctC
MVHRYGTRGIFALFITLTTAAAAIGQLEYPNQAVRLIVAVAPGGGIDTAARIVADDLSASLGQPVVIENHPGAAGNIGAALVFNSAPNGYTLLASSLTPITIANLLYKGLNFDPAAFEPVAVMSRIPNVLLVRPNFPADNIRER